jgi:hypothetical protein
LHCFWLRWQKANTNKPSKQIKAVFADREFIGCYWFKWLQKEGLTFYIRIKKNTQVSTQGSAKPVFWRFESLAINQAKTIAAPVRLSGHKLHLAGVKLAPDYVIIATNGAVDSALEIYGLRWGIETLFSALKKRGFDLETTHLTDIKRIEKLVAILAITLSWAHLVGEWLAEQQPLKIKKHGYQAKSILRYGLDYLQYLVLNLTHRIQQLLQCFYLWSEAIDSRLT